MKMMFVLFFIFAIGLLSVCHYFIYASLINFFNIFNPEIKRAFFYGLIILAFGYIAATLYINYSYNLFSRIIYWASSFWLGWLAYLIIGFLLAWLAIWILSIFKINLDTIYLGSAVIILSLLTCVWGTINAYNIKINQQEVKIKNLPAAWQEKKIIQLSDIHLGPVHGEKFLYKIINLVNQQQPDLVVVTGDYFDGLDGNELRLTAPLKALNSKRGIYLIYGNHEIYFGEEKTKAAFRDTPVKIMRDEVVDIDGLQLVGSDYRGTEKSSDIQPLLDKINQDKPSIMLAHVPDNINKIKNSSVNLLLCGHTHAGQLWPFNLFTWAIFHGLDYGLHQLTDNLAIYTSNGLGTWGPPMRIGNQPEIVVFTLKK